MDNPNGEKRPNKNTTSEYTAADSSSPNTALEVRDPPAPSSESIENTVSTTAPPSKDDGPTEDSGGIVEDEFILSARSAEYETRADEVPIEEQEILARIQELQMELAKLKTETQLNEDDISLAGIPDDPPSRMRRLVVVSNTLPINLTKNPANGRWMAQRTTGGLDKLLCLSGLRMDRSFLWVGWVGRVIPKQEEPIIRRLLLKYGCLPVFLSEELSSKHCNSFSSEVLWSLFHYTPRTERQKFDKSAWSAYKVVNESFADTIAEIYNEGDDVWIHDYHLMLLPSFLRQRLPKCRIGWFLHTPFPSSDVYCRLPVRKELLSALLCADLVAFQTYDYARHFLSSCQRVLGVDCSPRGIASPDVDSNHFVSLGVHPIGIDVTHFSNTLLNVRTLRRVQELRKSFEGKHVILGVDRLDYIKGIPHKLLAVELLLTKYPEWQQNVVLVQIGISSQTGDKLEDSRKLETVSHSYRDLLSEVNQLVGRINGAFGSLEYVPIHFINQSRLDHIELSALYIIADVCLITSTRDGMNLVSHEFVLCQHQRREMNRRGTETSNGTSSTTTTTESRSKVEPRDSVAGSSSVPTNVSKSTRERLRRDSRTVSRVRNSADNIPRNFSFTLGSPTISPVVKSQKTFMDPLGSAVGKHTGANPSAGTISPLRSVDTSPMHSEEEIDQEDEEEKRFWDRGPGVLVLSEFAGCAQSLSGAILVNPWDIEDTSSAIHQALTMSRVEKELRQAKLYRYVSTNTATHWADVYLEGLNDACGRNKLDSKKIPRLMPRDVLEAYKKAKNRVILSDYDGTLTPLQSVPQLATPSSFIKTVLGTLSEDPMNTVFILSGRERQYLDTWLEGVKVGVVAEDGFFYKLRNGEDEWMNLNVNHTSNVKWKETVGPIIQSFTDRTPGSYIEDKESSITWHYEDVDPPFGSWQAKDLEMTLERHLNQTSLEVIHGNQSVEVKHEGCSKAKILEALLKYLSQHDQIQQKNGEIDFIFCVGDDASDEEIFRMLDLLQKDATQNVQSSSSSGSASGTSLACNSNGGGNTGTVPCTPPSVSRKSSPRRAPASSSKSHFVSSANANTAVPVTERFGRVRSFSASHVPALSFSAPNSPAHTRLAIESGSSEICNGGSDMASLPPPPPATAPPQLDSLPSLAPATLNSFCASNKDSIRLARELSVFTVHIGLDDQPSKAQYCLRTLGQLRRILRGFAEISREKNL